MAPQHPSPRRPQRDRPFDERTGREAADFAVHQAGDGHPPGHAEHEDHEARAGAPQGGEQQQHHDAGEGEREVGEAQQGDADRAAAIPRHRPDRRADGEGQQHREEPNAQRDARAIDQPGPYVPPEPVGAQEVERVVQVRRERWQEARRDDVALDIGTSRRYERCADGRQEHRSQDGEPECPAAVAQ